MRACKFLFRGGTEISGQRDGAGIVIWWRASCFRPELLVWAVLLLEHTALLLVGVVQLLVEGRSVWVGSECVERACVVCAAVVAVAIAESWCCGTSRRKLKGVDQSFGAFV